MNTIPYSSPRSAYSTCRLRTSHSQLPCAHPAGGDVAPPSSVAKCLWGVFRLGVWGVVLVVCVCVGGGGVVLCRCADTYDSDADAAAYGGDEL